MGVCKKHRRKIICNNKKYVWYIKEDNESPYYILHIISEDKSVLLACPLKTDISYIISKGRIFQGAKMDGYWKRYLLPFEPPEIITPKFVARLIDWAEGGENAIKVQWNGKDIKIALL